MKQKAVKTKGNRDISQITGFRCTNHDKNYKCYSKMH